MTELLHAPTTTKTLEEGHASGQVFLAHHARLTEKQLRIRALLHQMRPLTRQRKSTKECRRISQRLKKIQKRQPRKATARQIFFKATARRAIDGLKDPKARQQTSKRIMSAHGEHFNALPSRVKLQLSSLARRLATEKIEENRSAEARMIRELRRLEQAEIDEIACKGKPNHLCQGRFADEDIDAASDFLCRPIANLCT